MYQRAISTLGCGELSLRGALHLAAQHRVDAVELRALGRTLDLPTYLSRRFARPFAASPDASAVAPRVIVLGSSCRLAGGVTADLEQVLPYVPWAERLGAQWIRVFDGGTGSYQADDFAAAAATLNWWRQLRKERGWRVDLAVETHDSLLTGARIRRLLEACPGVPILWDAHHTWRRGGEDPGVTWAEIAGHVVHIHVKDSLPEASAPASFRYVLPGTGDFPMSTLRAAIRGGFSGCVSLEWERWWCPELPTLAAALESARENHWW